MTPYRAAVDQFVHILAVMAGVTVGTYLTFAYLL